MLKIKDWLSQRANAQFKVLRMHGAQIDYVERISDSLRFSRLLTYNFIRDDLRYSVKFIRFDRDLIYTTYRIISYDNNTNELLTDVFHNSEINDLKYNEDISWHIKILMEQCKKFEQVHSKK